MAIVHADVQQNPNAMSSKDIMGYLNQGTQMRQADFLNQATRAQQIFDADESTRWGVVQRAGEQGIDITTALKPEYDNFLEVLRLQNEATGRRMSDADMRAYADNYFSRYYSWKAPNTKMQAGSAIGSVAKPATPAPATTPVASTAQPVTPVDQISSAPVPRAQVQFGAAIDEQGAPVKGVQPAPMPVGISRMTPDQIWAAAQDPESAGYQGILGLNMDEQAEIAVQEVMKSLQGRTPEQYQAILSDQSIGGATREAARRLSGGMGVSSRSPDVYTTMPGDSLWTIARGLLQSAGRPVTDTTITSLVSTIMQENSITDKNKIKDGYKLKIPAFAQGASVSGPTVAIIGEGGEREYVVPESKVSQWAQMALANPYNPPNPASISNGKSYIEQAAQFAAGKQGAMAGGQRVIPDEHGNVIKQPPAPSRPAPVATAPSPAPSSATLTPNPSSLPPAMGAPITKKPSSGWQAGMKYLELATRPDEQIDRESLRITPAVEASSGMLPGFQKRKEEARSSIKLENLTKAMQSIGSSPEARSWRNGSSQAFSEWFKTATPEELSLWRGMGDAAKYRDSRLGRESQERMFNEDMKLKWKYYQLQEAAAGGDEEAVRMQYLLEYGFKYIDSQQDIIEKQGAAAARGKDPVLDKVMNFVGQVLGASDTTVSRGFFGRYRITEALPGDKGGTQAPTGYSPEYLAIKNASTTK